MKKAVSIVLILALLMASVVLPGPTATAATQTSLGRTHRFAFGANDDRYDYVPGQSVEYKGQTIYPLTYSADDFDAIEQKSAVYHTVTHGNETLETLSLSQSRALLFTPLSRDGRPYELQPGMTYQVSARLIQHVCVSWSQAGPAACAKVDTGLFYSGASTKCGWVGADNEKDACYAPTNKEKCYPCTAYGYTKNNGGNWGMGVIDFDKTGTSYIYMPAVGENENAIVTYDEENDLYFTKPADGFSNANFLSFYLSGGTYTDTDGLYGPAGTTYYSTFELEYIEVKAVGNIPQPELKESLGPTYKFRFGTWDDHYDYVPGKSVVYKGQTIYPLAYNTTTLSSVEKSAVYQTVTVEDQTFQTLSLTQSSSVLFTPLTSEGKPFELQAGKTYKVTTRLIQHVCVPWSQAGPLVCAKVNTKAFNAGSKTKYGWTGSDNEETATYKPTEKDRAYPCTCYGYTYNNGGDWGTGVIDFLKTGTSYIYMPAIGEYDTVTVTYDEENDLYFTKPEGGINSPNFFSFYLSGGTYTDTEGLYGPAGTKYYSSFDIDYIQITDCSAPVTDDVIDFEDFAYADQTSRHAVGEDCHVQYLPDAASGIRALQYQYNAQPNYFKGTANALVLDTVKDDTLYQATFKYRLDDAVSDVQIKFFTANRFTRWAFISNYDAATYTVYTGDLGGGWKEATVYFRTHIAETSADALYMSFNPTVEGATTLYVDDVSLTEVPSGHGVVAYQGKDDTAYYYVEGPAGTAAPKPDDAPKARFAAFDGWYNNAGLTGTFSAPSVTAGQITYVYSAWNDLAEDFDSYPYAGDSKEVISEQLSLTKFSGSYVMNNKTDDTGVFPLGDVEDNTTYKVTLRYRSSAAESFFGFMTANARNNAVNRHVYADEGNTVTGNDQSGWQEITLFFTTAFARSGDTVGNVLYGCIGPHTIVEDICLTRVDILSSEGVSVLTDAAAEAAGKQAMRFYFGYRATDAVSLSVDGVPYTLTERGVVFSDATDPDAFVPHDVSEGTAPGVKTFGIRTDFGSYWRYDANRELTVYSVYLDGFTMKDTRLTGARGYLRFTDASGNRYTVYAPVKTDDVTSVKELTAEITDKATHFIADKNWSRFCIVHPKCMSYIYGMVIEDLQAYALTKGVELTDVTEKAEEKTYEIVIGETTRKATSLVERPVGNDYVIAVVGNKLVIRGGNDLALMQALQDFMDLLRLKDSLDCGLDIRDGYVKRGTYVPVSSNYTATLLEDFNGDTLDPMWGSYGGYGQGWPYTDCNLGGTVGVRKYGDTPVTTKSGRTVDLVRVENGNLVLGTAYVDPTYPDDISHDTRVITSKVSTFYTMLYQYGVLEFKVKLGDGPCCTSLWVNGDGSVNGYQKEKRASCTEFDLIETYGRMNYFASMVHEWWSPAVEDAERHVGFEPENSEYRYTPDADEADLYSSYHTFTFVWTPDGVRFAFDGKTWSVLDFNEFYYSREANNIIMSAGMGATNYGTKYDPARHKDYYETKIDYVYLYQVADMGSRYCAKK